MRLRSRSGAFPAPTSLEVILVNPVFVISWEPSAVITNQIPAIESRLFKAEGLP
jgi:hypothetical protein